MTDHVIGDKWELYWYVLPKLLDGMEYSQRDIERLGTDLRRDLGEAEGKFRIFCITVGRKSNVKVR